MPGGPSPPIQDFLVCMEMLVIALAHKLAFPTAFPADALRAGGAPPGVRRAIRAVVAQDDVASDFRDAWHWLKWNRRV
eukprot:gene928-3551_t